MFKAFTDFVNQVKAGIEKEAARFTNKEFLMAVVGSAAWVSAADGSIDDSEKTKMMQFIKISPALKHYDSQEVLSAWQHFMSNHDFSVDLMIDEVKKALDSVTDPEQKTTLVRVACAIGAADGDFDDDEKAVVTQIVKYLNLRPSEFGLA